MIYDHMVKADGKYYLAGEDVPEIKDAAVDETPLPFSDDDIELETKEKTYTKTEINRMNKAELQEIARNTGVEGVDNMTGTELKEYLFNVFGL